MHAFSLLKLSTSEQAASGSVKRHLQATRQYCSQMGLKLDDRSTSDFGATGYHRDKTALKCVLIALGSGQISKPCVVLVDAFTRDVRQAPMSLLELLREGVEIHSPSDRIIIKMSDGSGEVLFKLGQIFHSQLIRQVRSQRAKESAKRA